jgi:hypothetical protein
MVSCLDILYTYSKKYKRCVLLKIMTNSFLHGLLCGHDFFRSKATAAISNLKKRRKGKTNPKHEQGYSSSDRGVAVSFAPHPHGTGRILGGVGFRARESPFLPLEALEKAGVAGSFRSSHVVVEGEVRVALFRRLGHADHGTP